MRLNILSLGLTLSACLAGAAADEVDDIAAKGLKILAEYHAKNPNRTCTIENAYVRREW
jgi:hypothetical protein